VTPGLRSPGIRFLLWQMVLVIWRIIKY
jgi:hypothetical protein